MFAQYIAKQALLDLLVIPDPDDNLISIFKC